jgi:hypothetical protein
VVTLTVTIAASLSDAGVRIWTLTGFLVAFMIYMVLIKRIRCPKRHNAIGTAVAYFLVSKDMAPQRCPYCDVNFSDKL